MSEDRINSVIDEPRIKSEFDRLYALLQKAKDLVIELNASGKGIGLSAGFGESVAATKKANDALAQLSKLKEQINMAESEYGQLLAKSRTQLQEQNRLNKQAAQESLGMVDAYKKLVNQYNEAQRAAKNLAVTQGINSAAAKEAATRALDLSNQLKAIDASVGQYQRNVGNYASATFALSQILREAPAFAFNFQTGLLAISNNLPILFDEFKKLSAAIDENTGKQVGALGALRTLAGSLLSWNNLLTIGVGLITIFGKQIGDWLSTLFKSKDAMDKAAASSKVFNDVLKSGGNAYQDAAKLVNELQTNITLAKQGFLDKTKVLKQYNESIGETTGKVKTLDAAEQELIKNKEAYLQMLFEKAVAQKAYEEAADKALEAERERRKTDEESTSFILSGLPNSKDPSVLALYQKSAARNREKAAAEFDKDQKLLKEVGDEAQKRAAELAKKLGFDFFGDKFESKNKSNTAQEQLKALLESQKTALEASASQQEAIFNNEKETFDKRIAAAEAFSLIQNAIARKQQEIDVLEAGKVANKKLEAEETYKKASIQNEIERQKNFLNIAKSSADEEVKAIQAAAEKRSAAIAAAEDAELMRLGDLYSRGILSREQYESAKLQVQNKYANESLQSEIDFVKQIIDLQKSRGQDTAAAEKQLQDLQNKIRDENLKYEEDRLKADLDLNKKYDDLKLELEKQYADKLKVLRQEVFDFAVTIGDSFFEREKNLVQGRIDDIDRQKEAEIAAVNASTATQEEKAHQISVIEKQAQAEKEALERRQREIDARAATFQKFMALLQIGITTAEAVAKIQAQASILLADPFTAALAPVAYAQIPIVIASGALQAAAIAAKPVPRYKDGTDDHPGGPAYVNDGGRLEVLESPGGKAYIPYGSNVLMDIPAHYKVHPSVDDYLAAAGAATMRPLPAIDGTSASVDRMTKAVLDGFDKQTDKILDGLERSKTSVHINNSPLGVRATVSKAAQKMIWLNNEFDL